MRRRLAGSIGRPSGARHMRPDDLASLVGGAEEAQRERGEGQGNTQRRAESSPAMPAPAGWQKPRQRLGCRSQSSGR